MKTLKRRPDAKTTTIVISLLCILALLVSVPKTISYLTASSDKVVNTFAAGAISLTLDEAKVDGNGQATNDSRVKENSYKLVPGATLDKDPTVTVLTGSEECYVFLLVDDPLGSGDYSSYFTIDYSSDWEKVATSGTATLYVYKSTVDAAEGNKELTPIFKTIKISKDLTSDQVKALENKQITVQAYAVQTEYVSQDSAFTFAKEYFSDYTWTDVSNSITVKGAWTETESDTSSDTENTSSDETDTSGTSEDAGSENTSSDESGIDADTTENSENGAVTDSETAEDSGNIENSGSEDGDTEAGESSEGTEGTTEGGTQDDTNE